MIARSSTVAADGTDATDGAEEERKKLDLDDMSKAFPKGGIQRQKIKARDWKSSVAMYNDL